MEAREYAISAPLKKLDTVTHQFLTNGFKPDSDARLEFYRKEEIQDSIIIYELRNTFLGGFGRIKLIWEDKDKCNVAYEYPSVATAITDTMYYLLAAKAHALPQDVVRFLRQTNLKEEQEKGFDFLPQDPSAREKVIEAAHKVFDEAKSELYMERCDQLRQVMYAYFNYLRDEGIFDQLEILGKGRWKGDPDSLTLWLWNFDKEHRTKKWGPQALQIAMHDVILTKTDPRNNYSIYHKGEQFPSWSAEFLWMFGTTYRTSRSAGWEMSPYIEVKAGKGADGLVVYLSCGGAYQDATRAYLQELYGVLVESGLEPIEQIDDQKNEVIEKSLPKFFITHSWHDFDMKFARRLTADLRANGLDGFFDAYSIKPGDVIPTELQRGLEACDVYVPILSYTSLASPWCEEEINAALTLSKRPGRNGRPRIIPILIENCQDKTPIFLLHRLYIDFNGRYDEALKELLKEFGVLQVATLTQTLPAVPRMWLIAGSGMLGLVIMLGLIGWFAGQSNTNSTPTQIAQATVPIALLINTTVPTVFPTFTSTPTAPLTLIPTNSPTGTPLPSTPTRTSTFALSLTPTLGTGSTKISTDGAIMVFVPRGEFTMGSNDHNDQKPLHTVYLDDFWIDKFEVTNALYKKCVDAGECAAPQNSKSNLRDSYYADAQYDNYPVINVIWHDAYMYCSFAKKQLPTEAQWEKSARGTDGRVFPWGSTFEADKLNSDKGGTHDTVSVGSYSNGSSPYGVMDMAGNVWEWVYDIYKATYYKESPTRNPKNLLWDFASDQVRVSRGGSWQDDNFRTRASYRLSYRSAFWHNAIGFRCVESVG